MEGKNTYYWCIVPCCTNTSINTPNKIFIHVPRDPKVRQLWLQASRRSFKDVSTKAAIYCCEDHYDLPNDMVNWMEFNLMNRQVKKIMKKNVIPSKFSCQEDRKRAAASPLLRQACLKRQKREILKELNEKTTIVQSQCDEEFAESKVQQDSTLKNKSITDVKDETLRCSTSGFTTTDISVQVSIQPHYRSKYVQVQPLYVHTATSPYKVTTIDQTTSPLQKCIIQHKQKVEQEDCYHTTTDTDSYEPETSTSNDSSDTTSSYYQKVILKSSSAFRTIKIIKNKPRHYIGVTRSCYFIIGMLSKATGITEQNILLVLKEIRLNNTFVELADDFGVSTSNASKIFSKYMPIIAQYMRHFIFWPSSDNILQNVPISFRHRYSHVQAIIDASEIEIEKPSDPVKQALSWSEYKKCNTIKYLISSTPDGIINYISEGFSGRISDTMLVEECGYLQILPPGASIMADRGFKHIEKFLSRMGCTLVRPPSVQGQNKLSKKEVLETKRIASLRIHIERTIRRIREFKLLKPHSCINNKFVPAIGNAITIAATLINLQGPIIKK